MVSSNLTNANDPSLTMEPSPRPDKMYKELKTPVSGIEVAEPAAPWRRFGASSWTVKYKWAANVAQLLIVGSMVVYMFGQMYYYTTDYREGLSLTFKKWWGVPLERTETGPQGHKEMVRPTLFFLFCTLPLIISLLLMEFLRHFNVRRITSKYVLRMALVLRRKPRFGPWVSYWSYGEWFFLVGLIILGNILVFYLNVNRRIQRMYNRQREKGLPEEIPFDNLLQFMSVTLGFNSIYNMAFLFLPATRNCAWMEFFNISYATGIKYHRWLGMATVFTAVVHCAGYYWLWVRQEQWIKKVLPCFDCPLGEYEGYKVWVNVFGQIALLMFLLISITSIPFIRRRLYEVFYYVHHLFIPAVIFSVLHWGGILWWILPTFVLYMVSRCMSSANAYVPVPVVEFSALENDIIKVVVERSHMRDGHYKVGQFVYLNIPSLSKLQWHAFTISSSPRGNSTTLTILLKSLGDWTTELVDYIDQCEKKQEAPLVYMDGYYGSSLEMYREYNTICLIGGGIGVTPLFSILEDIAARVHAGDQLRQRIVFIFTFRELSLLEEIHPVLMRLREADPQEEYFTWHFYLTRPPSQEVLDRKVNWERLNGKCRLTSTSHAQNKNRIAPKAFAEPLRSRTFKSLTYLVVFTVTLLVVCTIVYGSKVDHSLPYLWPAQRLAEVMAMLACGLVTFVIIFFDRRHKASVMTKPSSNPFDITGDAQQHPFGLMSSDVGTFQDLMQDYKVNVGQRPQIDLLMKDVLAAHDEFSAATSHVNPKTTIGVFQSGPDALKRGTEYAMADLGSQHFDTHEEEFEL